MWFQVPPHHWAVGTLLGQAKWEMLDCPLLGDGLTEGTDTPLKGVGEYSVE